VDVLDVWAVVVTAPGHVATGVDIVNLPAVKRDVFTSKSWAAWPERQALHFWRRRTPVHFSLNEFSISGSDDETIDDGAVSVGHVARRAVVGREVECRVISRSVVVRLEVTVATNEVSTCLTRGPLVAEDGARSEVRRGGERWLSLQLVA
jgi:hypothetical protein